MQPPVLNQDSITSINHAKVGVTIDFEDFSFDLGRVLGRKEKARKSQTHELARAYKKIKRFLRNFHGDTKATFFAQVS